MPAGNLVLSVIGAAGGAAIGAVIWMLVEYFVHLQVGYVAILVGALAGWGAVALGKVQSPTVGVICAIAGVVGIVAGSYGAFRLAFGDHDYFGYLANNPADLLWMALFGGIGLVYGYRVGSGARSRSRTP